MNVMGRAKEYPYWRPDCSFVFLDGECLEFEDTDWRGPDQLADLEVTRPPDSRKRRLCEVLAESQNALELLAGNFVPVLAVGSNGSPQQLARKFPPAKFPNGVLIPVVRAVLEDFDVVYAPLLAAY